MMLSFGGICLIATSTQLVGDAQEVDDAEPQTSPGVVLADPATRIVVGSALLFITSWMYASNAILTRQMQKIHFTVFLFYYSMLACVLVFSAILVESLITGQSVRLWAYR